MEKSQGKSFARRVFTIAGWYGLIVMFPQYFLEAKIGRDYPPPITHPENFYGFIGVTIAWQLLFLVIARDPVRFRPAMLPAVVEKATFAIAVIVLYLQGRVASAPLPFAAIDCVLGTLFLVSYVKSGSESS
ncbi:MAG TPA: hypothetical protein VFD67_16720 [Gemmatimonadaceae bacterium]|nr:hypothetical protein [Gemmatimonadaceae bacterium]